MTLTSPGKTNPVTQVLLFPSQLSLLTFIIKLLIYKVQTAQDSLLTFYFLVSLQLKRSRKIAQRGLQVIPHV